MPEFLTFQLSGAMASWGEVAVGEVRPTRSRPTKSAVLGLVAAALGYRRDDVDCLRSLFDGVGFAVRVDDPGEPVRDFQTSQRPISSALKAYKTSQGHDPRTRIEELQSANTSALYTTTSVRHYWCNGVWTVCLWRRGNFNGPQLQDIAAALKCPVFMPYLGRKSCPLDVPLGPRISEAEGIGYALAQYETLDPRSFGKGQPKAIQPKGSRLIAWDSDAPGISPEATHHVEVRDVRQTYSDRAFAPRTENVALVSGE